jgi:hypothetical protein
MSDGNFDEVPKGTEKTEWKAFKLVTDKFLGRHKASNFRELVGEILETYRTTGCNMAIELHFLHYHLDTLRQNPVEFSGEDREMFLHGISNVKNCYQGMEQDYAGSLNEKHQMHARGKQTQRRF